MDFNILKSSETENIDKTNGNIDIFVSYNRETYVATFFTYQNILSLIDQNKKTGECLNGKFFWASDMILINDLKKETINQVINEMINDNSFLDAFTRCAKSQL